MQIMSHTVLSFTKIRLITGKLKMFVTKPM